MEVAFQSVANQSRVPLCRCLCKLRVCVMPGPAGVKHIFAIGPLTAVQTGEGIFG